MVLLRSASRDKDAAPGGWVPGAVNTRIVALWNVRPQAPRLLAMSQQPHSSRISSADGTTIAFDRYGEGKPLILIGGASYDRSTIVGVAEAIAGDLLAVTYDRRGRGGSTNEDTEFARERELEDLEALLHQVGGSASLFGHSSGGVLALEAAMRGMPIERLVVFEPPYMLEGTRPLPPTDLLNACALSSARIDVTMPSSRSTPKRSASRPRRSMGCGPRQCGIGGPRSRTLCPMTSPSTATIASRATGSRRSEFRR